MSEFQFTMTILQRLLLTKLQPYRNHRKNILKIIGQHDAGHDGEEAEFTLVVNKNRSVSEVLPFGFDEITCTQSVPVFDGFTERTEI